VDNNYLDLGVNKSGFVHTLPSHRLSEEQIDRLMQTDSEHLANLKKELSTHSPSTGSVRVVAC
jgi:hypothetical protein